MKFLIFSLLLSIAACDFIGETKKAEAVPGFGEVPSEVPPELDVREPFSGALSMLTHPSKVEHTFGNMKQHHHGFLNNVKSLHFTTYDVAALRNDGSVVTWKACCHTQAGSVGDAEVFQDVVEIVSSDDSFVALKKDGSLASWGWGSSGIDLLSIPNGLDVAKATSSAFAFLSDDGSLTVGGHPNYGGSTTFDFSIGVKQVVSNYAAFAVLLNDGSVVSWGDPQYGGTSPNLNPSKVVKKLYSNRLSFLAVYEDGTADGWGSQNSGGDTSGLDFSSGIKEVYNNESTYLALKNDGNIVLWGNSNGGADTSQDLSGTFVDVYPFYYGYFAVKEDDSVIGWGSYSGPLYSADFSSGVKKIASDSGHIALKNDGSVVTWGQYPLHFNYSHLPPELRPTSDIVDVATKSYYFSALRSDGVAVAWGDGWYKRIDNVVKIYSHYKSLYFLDTEGKVTIIGPDSLDIFGQEEEKLIKSVHSNLNATLVIYEDNSIKASGEMGYGANISGVDLSAGVEKIVFNDYSFSALLSNGKVVSWGSASYGGDSAALNLLDVIDITATSDGYTALKSDNTLVSWGADKANFNPTGLDLTGAKNIFSSYGALAILKEDGSVLTLGSTHTGGNSTGLDLTNVKKVFSANNGFAVLKNDGSALSWGSDYNSINSQLTGDVKEIFASGWYVVAIKENGDIVKWGWECKIDESKKYTTGIGVRNGILLVDSEGLLVPACGVNHGGYNSLYADDFSFQTDGANIYLFK